MDGIPESGGSRACPPAPAVNGCGVDTGTGHGLFAVDRGQGCGDGSDADDIKHGRVIRARSEHLSRCGGTL